MQELQKKREEKRQEVKKVAEEEIAYLHATGKITKNLKNGLGKSTVILIKKPALLNSVLNNEIVDQSELKALADTKINVIQTLKFMLGRV